MRLTLVATSMAIAFSMGHAANAGEIRFEKTQIDAAFRSEGVAVGDYNNDGKLDIAAGFVWYEAPDWTMHVITDDHPWRRGAIDGKPPQFKPKGYSNAFSCFADDVNGDGWTDVIVVDFPGTETWWFENPKGKKENWKRHVITRVTNNESPQMIDIDGDGTLEFIAAFSPDPKKTDGPEKQMAIFKRDAEATAEWIKHPISAKGADGCNRYSHGLGIGDVNGDGVNDILSSGGWWEGRKDLSAGPWQLHKVPFGAAAHMQVYDFDGDGDNDVLSSSPHAFGLWWWERTASGNWTKHAIDDSFSQLHAVCFADINGDGLMDFVTGKRFWAHNGRDRGHDQPAVLYWFELQRENGKPKWVRHQIDDDSGMGTQFEVVDIDGDGLPDVVAANKKGVHVFRQVREE